MKSSLPRNIVFGFLSWLLPLVSTLVVTPFVVRALGAEEYGLLTLVLGFISYSFTFGIGRAATKYVAEFVQTKEHDRINDVLSATFALSLLIGAAGALVLYFSTKFLIADVLQVEAHLQTRAIDGFYLAALTVLLLMIQQVFSATLQAIGRFDWFSHLTTIFSTVLSAGNLILVWTTDADALALLWWNLLVTAAGAIAFFVSNRILFPDAKLIVNFSRRSFFLIARFSLGIIAYQVSGNLLFLFERSWITRHFGTENVTFYAVPMMLATYVQIFVTSFVLVLMPLVSEIGAAADKKRLRDVYERATKYVFFLIAFVAVALIAGSREFLHLWLGAEFAARSSAILMLHVATFGAMTTVIVAWQMSEGLGFPARNGWLVFSWLIFSIPLIVIFSGWFGLHGVAGARALSVVVAAPIFIWLVERLTFGRALADFWQKTLPPLVPAAAAANFVIYFGLKSAPPGWLSFLAINLFGAAVYLIVLRFLKFFTVEEQNRLRGFFKRAAVSN